MQDISVSFPYETVRAAKTQQRHGTDTDSAFRNPCLKQSCCYIVCKICTEAVPKTVQGTDKAQGYWPKYLN